MISRIEISLQEWRTNLPTGAVAFDLHGDVIDSEYCDSVEEFAGFFERHKNEIEDSTDLFVTVNAEDIENCFQLVIKIRNHFYEQKTARANNQMKEPFYR